jgi:Mitochondrial mRNA-processing protein COX24, C-terminal
MPTLGDSRTEPRTRLLVASLFAMGSLIKKRRKRMRKKKHKKLLKKTRWQRRQQGK